MRIVDRALLVRALALLGSTEAVMAMAAFSLVLVTGGWSWGEAPSSPLLAVTSGTAFAAIALGQMANAFACRSTTTPVWRMNPTTNRLVLGAVALEMVLLATFLGFTPLADLLGGAWPSSLGWLAAAATPVALIAVDGLAKWRRTGPP